MENKEYLQIYAGENTFLVNQDEVVQILAEPVFTRILSGEPLLYGIFYDGQEMVPLLDLSAGVSAGDKDFGRACILLQRGTQKIAAAVSQIKKLGDEPEEEELEKQDPFRLFAQLLEDDQ